MKILNFSFISFIFPLFCALIFLTISQIANSQNFDCNGLADATNAKQQKQIKKCIEKHPQTNYLNREYLKKFSKLTQFWSPNQKAIAKRRTFMKLNKNFNECLKFSVNEAKSNMVKIPEICACWQKNYQKHIQFLEQDFNIS